MSRHTTPLNSPGLWGSRATCPCRNDVLPTRPSATTIAAVLRGGATAPSPQGVAVDAEYQHPSGVPYGRAPPPDMPQIGYVTHPAHNEPMALFGRRNHFTRRMEYYVSYGAFQGGAGHIPLCTDETRDLFTGDGVEVPGRPGRWNVHLYNVRALES